jgi:nicotinate-nucleotide pyrophosphorylase (carboxylating)
MNEESSIKQLIDIAIKEDVGEGDHSTLACIPEGLSGTARLIAKEEGIIAGVEIAGQIFSTTGPGLIYTPKIKDGSPVSSGDIIFHVEGEVHALLKAERLVLNIMQRMSGIATETSRYVKVLAPYNTKVLDTRKTIPGMRILDKMAVRIGGGENHRFGLYDMIMLKDNHIDYAGGIKETIIKTTRYITQKKLNIPIEIEARNLNEVKEILEIGKINRIMLDNFSIEETREAVTLIGKRFEIESSGMINLKTAGQYAACGVDYISVGSLTHKVKSLDLSLLAK